MQCPSADATVSRRTVAARCGPDRCSMTSPSRRRQAAHFLAAHLGNGQAALLELFFLFGELVALHDAFWRRSAFRGLHCCDSPTSADAVNEKGAEALFSFTVRRAKRDHSRSIINGACKSAWLRGLAVIDMRPCRRFYRQERPSLVSAGDGAICGATTFSTP